MIICREEVEVASAFCLLEYVFWEHWNDVDVVRILQQSVP